MFTDTTPVVTFRKYDAKNGGRTAGVSMLASEARVAVAKWIPLCSFIQVRNVEDTVRFQWNSHRNTWVEKPGKNAPVVPVRKLDTPEHAEYRATLLAY